MNPQGVPWLTTPPNDVIIHDEWHRSLVFGIHDSLIRRSPSASADSSFPASRPCESVWTLYGFQGKPVPRVCGGPQVGCAWLGERLVRVCGIDCLTRRPFGISCIYGVYSYGPKAVEHFEEWEPHSHQAGVESCPSRRRSCLEARPPRYGGIWGHPYFSSPPASHCMKIR